MKPEDLQRVLETAFEPYGDGFVYYKNRWSPGIQVSAEEREQLLRSFKRGVPFAAKRLLGDREPVRPPRKGSTKLMLAVFPAALGWGGLAVAAELARRALGVDNVGVRIVLLALAAVGLSVALFLILGGLWARRGSRGPN